MDTWNSKTSKDIKTIHTDVMKNNQNILEIINSIEKDEAILIIMVNWLHEYPQSKVTNLVEKILSLNRKIIIIMDIYQRKEFSKIPENKIVHKFKDIKNNIFFKKVENLDKVRDLVIFSNKNIVNFD